MAHNEINHKIELKKQLNKPDYQSSEGLIVNFRINQDDIFELNLPNLFKLFKEELTKDVIITQNNSVLLV